MKATNMATRSAGRTTRAASTPRALAALLLVSLLHLQGRADASIADELSTLAQLHDDGQLSLADYEVAKKKTLASTAEDASSVPTADNAASIAAILEDLDLLHLLPTFKKHGITTHEALLLLDQDSMQKYMGLDNLGERLKLVRYIERENSPSNHGLLNRDAIARELADLLVERKSAAAAVAEQVAHAIAENNARIFERVEAMIEKARLGWRARQEKAD